MKKLTQLTACLPALLFLLAACMAKGGEKEKTELQKAAYGEATVADAAKAIAEAKKNATVAAGFEQLTPASGSIFTMPATGNIVAALRGNSAAWRSELYLQAGNRDIQLIADTRQGPLNKESQHAFVQGTAINFYIVVHTPPETLPFTRTPTTAASPATAAYTQLPLRINRRESPHSANPTGILTTLSSMFRSASRRSSIFRQILKSPSTISTTTASTTRVIPSITSARQ
ncbi:MAG: hypothetical protein J0L53_17010 [Spirochaetes bacterium]|nr:hypothetical protein [Spirochaetota bacterium]